MPVALRGAVAAPGELLAGRADECDELADDLDDLASQLEEADGETVGGIVGYVPQAAR